MKKLAALFYITLLACDTGNLNVVTNLPRSLHEASGIEKLNDSELLWMINDSGNASSLYLVSEEGNILRELKINSKNTDWEDITKDKEGNVYIGNFGNNANKRKDLVILKVQVEM